MFFLVLLIIVILGIFIILNKNNESKYYLRFYIILTRIRSNFTPINIVILQLGWMVWVLVLHRIYPYLIIQHYEWIEFLKDFSYNIVIAYLDLFHGTLSIDTDLSSDVSLRARPPRRSESPSLPEEDLGPLEEEVFPFPEQVITDTESEAPSSLSIDSEEAFSRLTAVQQLEQRETEVLKQDEMEKLFTQNPSEAAEIVRAHPDANFDDVRTQITESKETVRDNLKEALAKAGFSPADAEAKISRVDESCRANTEIDLEKAKATLDEFLTKRDR